jgi:hypothetical protein
MKLRWEYSCWVVQKDWGRHVSPYYYKHVINIKSILRKWWLHQAYSDAEEKHTDMWVLCSKVAVEKTHFL